MGTSFRWSFRPAAAILCQLAGCGPEASGDPSGDPGDTAGDTAAPLDAESTRAGIESGTTEPDGADSSATSMSSTDAGSAPPVDPVPLCALESGEVAAIAAETPVGPFPVAYAAWGWDFCSNAPHMVFAVDSLGSNGDATPPALRLGVQLVVEDKGPDLFVGTWPAELVLQTSDGSGGPPTLGTIELLEPFDGLDAPQSLHTELHVRVVAQNDGWNFVAEAHAVPWCHEYGNCTCACG